MEDEIVKLEKQARRLRRLVLETLAHAKAGHSGGSMSIIEIMTVLWFHCMRVDPKNRGWEERDRFVLSKGHSSPPYYACLAERGFFPLEKLEEFDRIDGMLQGHPCKLKTPGVDMSTGSLGQGLSAAIGIAIGGRLCGLNFHTYALLGDGETQEGQVWEAILYAGHHKIDRLTAIIDYNKLQLAGRTNDTLNIEPLARRWETFGWVMMECDGHNIAELVETLDKAREIEGNPVGVIAHTVKGKGISFMENVVAWHAKAPSEEEYQQALKELDELEAKI